MPQPTKPLTWLGITPILNGHPLWGTRSTVGTSVRSLPCSSAFVRTFGADPLTAVTEGNRQRFDFFTDGNGARGSGHSFVHGADALGLLGVDQGTNLTKRVLTSARRNMRGPRQRSPPRGPRCRAEPP